jgi:hypothetical protein
MRTIMCVAAASIRVIAFSRAADEIFFSIARRAESRRWTDAWVAGRPRVAACTRFASLPVKHQISHVIIRPGGKSVATAKFFRTMRTKSTDGIMVREKCWRG